VENESEHVMRCTKCFGRDVRPSRKGSFLDALMEKLHRTPFRCRGCHNRFYVYIRPERDDVEETAETSETPENGHSEAEEAHDPDVAKPAEP
jgi:bisphosphoglycerate-independent phosphoglycerate mutase (AlkP superfamily)